MSDHVHTDHERIWLQNPNDAAPETGRLWCQDKVWPESSEEGEPTEYVRADLYDALQAERDELDFLLHEGGTMEEQLSKAEAERDEARARALLNPSKGSAADG